MASRSPRAIRSTSNSSAEVFAAAAMDRAAAVAVCRRISACSMEIPWPRPAQSRDKSSDPRFSAVANQEPLADKLTTARENDVTGVTERWDLTVCRAGTGCRMHVCFAGRTRPQKTLNRSHIKPKQGLGLRRRGFMAVGEAVPSDLSDSRLCNGAVHRADADRRRQNGDDASDDQPSGATCHNTLHRSIRRKAPQSRIATGAPGEVT